MATAHLDSVGWTYMGLAIAWTVALFTGIAFLYFHRHLPSLQIRRLPLVFTAVLSLHAYGFVCLIAYVIAPLAPCSAEYWMMSIWLPFGIAMFQAANTQFLHVASRQRTFVRNSMKSYSSLDEKQAEQLASSRWRRILRGVDRADSIDRMLYFIGGGLIVQLVLALFIFFASRKFHPSYGFINWTIKGTEPERVQCSKGWEWWLTIVWQFFWSWIYAPYTLWRSRKIRDVHGWRIQTICCCIAGLPASPLWLAGMYVPQMAPVNQYFMPPTWFALSIFFIELFAIGFPILQVFKSQTLHKETLDAIESWQKRQQINTHNESVVDSASYDGKSSAYTGTTLEGAATARAKTSLESQKSDMLTMAGLENALRSNPEPLLHFAALKDFSGENISFITHIADWKRGWRSSSSQLSPNELRKSLFVAAVRIYASFVSLDYSEFPVNISSKSKAALDLVFERAANKLFRNNSITSSTSSSATPFDAAPPDASSTTDLKTGMNLNSLGRSNFQSATEMMDLGREDAMSDVDIPLGFGISVFDDAEAEIKYLVLTNTWPKFVNAGMAGGELDVDGDVKMGRGRWWERVRGWV
ncbi:hypothetical protein BDV96DRAFT_615244 [Lophiotrema nucula]|uniref:RGS domain-containing protein n=1 Tax=Lophiotrema nucula TaxID=690887 RepID=A0A6A5YUA9_9PLEO|nr:hypothetical protein BDV96DRAFT_615244 [Lophiotrema nucula]